VTGTYPNFTISSPASGAGTVTSIDVSGGTTGLTTSGGPVTTSGTITLAGTLNVANGGTGATTLSSGYVLKGNGTSAVSASVIYDDGTNVGIGTTLPVERLRVEGNIIVPISKSFYSYTADYGIGTPDSNGLQIFTNTADVMRFGQRAAGAFTERMRINASGNLLVGTTTDFGGRLTLIPATTPTTFAGGNQLQIGEATNNTAYRLQMGYINDPVQGYVGSLQAYAGSVPTNLCLQGDGGNVIVGGATSVYGTSGRGLIETNGATSAINALKVGGTAIAYFGVNSSAAEIVTPGAIPLNFLTSNTQRLSINSSGNVTANVDMRAPIYYDSANTSYYLDPAGGSRLNAVYVTGGDVDPSNIGAGVGIGNIYEPATAFAAYGIAFGASAGQHGAIVYGSNIMYFGTENGSDNTMMTKATLNSSGSFTANGDVRAPIFYDSANTSYYLDPTGSTSLNTAGNLITSGNLTLNNGANRYVRIGSATNYSYDLQTTGDDFQIIEAGVTPRLTIKYPSGFVGLNTASPTANLEAFGTDASIIVHYSGQSRGGIAALSGARIALTTTTSGDDLVFGYAGSPITSGGFVPRMTIDNGTGSITAGVDFRAPIFYDSDNTAFFFDGSSTSVLNVMRANSIQFSSGNEAITLTNGSYLFLRDPTSHVAIYLGGADPASYYDNNTHWFRNRGGSNMAIINPNGIQAPIFYDINNTGYYGDFAGTSNIFNLTISGTGNKYLVIQSTDSGEAMVRYIGATGPGWYVGKRTSTSLVDTASFHFYSENAAATVAGIDVSGNMLASGSMRAPIFYDQNNTGYYLDPNSSGLALRTSGYWVADSTAWAGEINGKIQFHANNWYFGASDSWIFRATNGTQPFYVTQTGVAVASGDMRAPLFYDANNTGFYMDPANGTVLGGSLAVNGSRSVNISSGAGSITLQGDAGGWSIGTYFLGSSGTNRGGFGALGGGNGLSYLWAGNDYNNAALYLYASNYAESPGSLRAPIFYDSNNTGYYVDAASTSVLNQIQFPPNTAQISGNETSSYGSIAIRGARSGWYGIHFQGGGNAPHLMFESGNGGIYFESAGRWASYYSQGNNCWGFGTSATSSAYNIYCPTGVYSAGRVDGTIFNDSNDTGYYIDLNSTSDAAMRMRGGMLLGPNPTWGAYLRVGSNGWVGDHSSIAVTNGNLHIDAQPGFDIYLAWYNTSTIQVGGSIAAIAYYDRNNTAYYLDASSTGTSLNVAGSIIAGGNVTAYSDIRVKDNVETIPNALDKLSQIRGVTYTRTDLDDKEQRYAGVIAQEIEAVLPEAVRDLGNIKAVDYNATIGLLIQAVKELTNKVKALEAKEQ
jgi:hypothetical protein